MTRRTLINPLVGNGPLYRYSVIGTVAVDGWAITFASFGIAGRVLGGLGPRPVASSLYQM